MVTTTQKRNNRYLTAGTVVMAVGDGLTLPYLMVYLHDGRGIALWLAGLVVAVAGGTSLFFSVPAGAMVDRIKPVHASAFGLVLNAASVLALAYAPSAIDAAAALLLGGLAASLIWPARSVLIYSISTPDARTKAFAVQFAALNAGIGFGGLVAGQIVHLYTLSTYQTVFVAQAVLTCAAAIILEVGFGAQPRSAVDDSKEESPPRGGMFDPLKDGTFMRFMAVYVPLTFFGYGQLEGAWAAYSTQYAGATARVVGFAFAANTTVIVIAQMIVVRYAEKLRRSRALALVAAGWAACWIITLIATLSALRGLWADLLLVFSLGFFGLAETMFQPVSSMLPNELAPPDKRGRYNAFTSAAWGASGLVGPPIAGVLVGAGSALAWPIPVAAALVASGMGALRLGKKLPKEAEYPEVTNTS